jgi:hypothetical protein
MYPLNPFTSPENPDQPILNELDVPLKETDDVMLLPCLEPSINIAQVLELRTTTTWCHCPSDATVDDVDENIAAPEL